MKNENTIIMVNYLGILKCSNCNEYTHSYLYKEIGKKSGNSYIFCQGCNNMLKIEDILAKHFENVKALSKEKTEEIWTRFSGKIEIIIKKMIKTLKENDIDYNSNKENLKLDKRKIYDATYIECEKNLKNVLEDEKEYVENVIAVELLFNEAINKCFEKP